MGTPSTAVGPGLGAFVAFFVLALVLWLLMRNMNGRMRRMAYREQQRVAELEAREASQEGKPAARKGKRGRKQAVREAPAPGVADPKNAAPDAAQEGSDEPTP